jgi:hypothetical protein
MYSVEGEIVVKPSPESVIGMYGTTYSESQQSIGGNILLTRHGGRYLNINERVADFYLKIFTAVGLVPSDAELEHITSLEQAEKYVVPMHKKVNVIKRSEPNLEGVLEQQVPDDADLLSGAANLWENHYMPARRLHVASSGNLLRQVQYNPEGGWQDTHENMYGERAKRGFVTPFFDLQIKYGEIIEPLLPSDMINRLNAVNKTAKKLYAKSKETWQPGEYLSFVQVFSESQERMLTITNGFYMAAEITVCKRKNDQLFVKRPARSVDGVSDNDDSRIIWGLMDKGNINPALRAFNGGELTPDEAIVRLESLLNAQDLEQLDHLSTRFKFE